MLNMIVLIGLILGATISHAGKYKPNVLEAHFINDWLKMSIDDSTLEFVTRRLTDEAIETIENEELKEKVKRCRAAFGDD